jgi:hypothetical protein
MGLRKTGKTTAAKTFLERSIKAANATAWPTKLLRLVAGQIPADELIRSTTDIELLTEVRSLTGEFLYLNGDTKNAAIHFRWVKENGNRDRITYQLARVELERL